MPYVDCPSCGLKLYTAAVGRRHDDCPRCGTTLHAPTRTALLGRPLRLVSEAMRRQRRGSD